MGVECRRFSHTERGLTVSYQSSSALLYTYFTNFVSRVMLREANRDKSVPSVMLKKEKKEVILG